MINACRICFEQNLELVLDYGLMPLVNNLDEDKKYPLRLVHCHACGLVQITETISPEKLFSNYCYFSSQSQTMLTHSEYLVDELVKSRHLNEDSLVIELASNDGYLLQYYQDYDVPILGIEPARNIARVATEKGIPTLCVFFGIDEAKRLQAEGIRADVIHAHNVLAHVADLHGFVEGIRVILKPDGLAVVEVPYLRGLVEKCEFDTVYHEHLCYFALRPLGKLFKLHGLAIVEVSFEDIHGGSLRLYVTHGEGSDFNDDCYLDDFAERASNAKHALMSCLTDIKGEGGSIAAYGAAAKGCVLLNACGIDNRTIDYCVDSTPAKQGKRIPGTGIPIYPPRKLMENQPDYCLLLAWNFADEIMKKEPGFRGKWILPNPLRICG
jgi:SAM-dependent methyltransferase